MYKHNLYKVLQVRDNATDEMILDGYMRRMRMISEIVCKTPADDRRYMLDMAKINIAHDVLSDAQKRKEYDKSLAEKAAARDEKRQNESEENYDAIDWRERFHQLENEHYKLTDTFELHEELLLFLSNHHLRPDIMKRSTEIAAEIDIARVYKIEDTPAPQPETFLDFFRGREWKKWEFAVAVFIIILIVKGFFSFF